MQEMFGMSWLSRQIQTNASDGVEANSPLKVLAETCQDTRLEFIPPSKAEFRQWKLPSPFSYYACDAASSGQASLEQPPASHVLVTASFGRILTQKHLSHFLPARRLNVHPSLLPQYRGPAPIQHSLLNGDQETGVCVIEMLPAGKKQTDTRKVGIDAGDIWASKSTDQPSGATFSQMRDQLGIEGGKLLVELLRDFKNQKRISPQPQCVGGSTLKIASMVRLEDAQFSPITWTAEEASRRWRAIAHQRPITAILQVSTEVPTRAVQLHDLQVHMRQPDEAVEQRLASYPGAVICSASNPGNASEKALFIRCLGGSILSVRRIKPEGKPVLDAQAFWNGVRKYKDIKFIGHGAA
ncbi:hypothetical protein H1R20_g10096, partial [Candolleomyces eurysporus]